MRKNLGSLREHIQFDFRRRPPVGWPLQPQSSVLSFSIPGSAEVNSHLFDWRSSVEEVIQIDSGTQFFGQPAGFRLQSPSFRHIETGDHSRYGDSGLVRYYTSDDMDIPFGSISPDSGQLPSPVPATSCPDRAHHPGARQRGAGTHRARSFRATD